MKKTPVAIIVFAFAVVGIVTSATFASAVPQPNIHDTILSIVQSIQSTVTSTDQKIDNLSTSPVCPANKVQHWNKIVFYFGADANLFLEHDTLPSIQGSSSYPHEVLVKADPNIAINIRQAVADKLNVMGYYFITNSQIQIPVDPNMVNVISVTYSTICAET